MWAIGIYDLHLTDEQFWSLTPAQFTALTKRAELHSIAEDNRFGVVGSLTIAPYSKHKIEPGDLFPRVGNYQERERKAKEYDSRYLLSRVLAINQQLGGRDVRPDKSITFLEDVEA